MYNKLETADVEKKSEREREREREREGEKEEAYPADA